MVPSIFYDKLYFLLFSKFYIAAVVPLSLVITFILYASLYWLFCIIDKYAVIVTVKTGGYNKIYRVTDF